MISVYRFDLVGARIGLFNWMLDVECDIPKELISELLL